MIERLGSDEPVGTRKHVEATSDAPVHPFPPHSLLTFLSCRSHYVSLHKGRSEASGKRVTRSGFYGFNLCKSLIYLFWISLLVIYIIWQRLNHKSPYKYIIYI